jgi:regulator of sigma E protease
MSIIFSIIAFLFAISILVLIHECGHFLVARFFNVKVLKFSIGFGKPLFSWKGKNYTQYLISAIPLGGYVKMLDTREEKVAYALLPFAFDRKPVWQRILVVLAGPITNIVFTIFTFWLIFLIGINSPKPIIGKVLPNTIVSQVGIKSGDEIISIANEKVTNWQDVMLKVFAQIGEKNVLPVSVKDQDNIIKNYDLDLKNWHLDMLQLDPLRDLGIEPYHPLLPTIINEIGKNSPAEKAGFLKNDKIIAIDNKNIQDWDEFVEYIKDRPKQQLNFSMERQGNKLQLQAITGWKFGNGWKKVGYLGINPIQKEWPKEYYVKQQYSIPLAFSHAFENTFVFLSFNFIVIEKLITGKISMLVLGGPISIFQSAAAALNQGIVVYFSFLALLSLMLAFVNLLPIPGLDGGYVIFLLLEAITKKPLPNSVQILIFRLGIIFLVLLMFQATLNDLMRLWK